MFIDGFVDISAGVVFTVLAGLVLGSVDSRAALMLLIPLVGVALATRTLDARIKRYRAADRIAASAVSGLLGDVMAAATTVKVNNAIEPTIAHLQKLVDARRRTAVRDRVLDESVWAFSQGAADVGLGLVLLSAAGAMAAGRFSVGQLAVFSAYLGWLSFLPRMVGRMLARRKQVSVAFDRMSRLVADTNADNTVTDRLLPIGLRQIAKSIFSVSVSAHTLFGILNMSQQDGVGDLVLRDIDHGTDIRYAQGVADVTQCSPGLPSCAGWFAYIVKGRTDSDRSGLWLVSPALPDGGTN